MSILESITGLNGLWDNFPEILKNMDLETSIHRCFKTKNYNKIKKKKQNKMMKSFLLQLPTSFNLLNQVFRPVFS